MVWKLVSAAVLAAAFGAYEAGAQSSRELGGPAELPPASFKGQQYVDSRGCVFLRGGYGGQTTWVPRITRDRKQLCGYTGSGGQVAVAEAAPTAAPKPAPVPKQPVARTAPLDTVASVTTAPKIRAAAPAGSTVATTQYVPAKVTAQPPARRVVAAPAQTQRRPAAVAEAAAPARQVTVVTPRPVAGAASGQGLRLACPASAPVAKRLPLHGGGTKLMCTDGTTSLVGVTLPRYVSGDLTVVVQGQAVRASTKSAKLPDLPAGYEPAWDDGRLNVNRGRQTVQGVIDMDEVWTRTSPAELREDSTVKRKRLVIVVRPSTKAQAEAPQVVASSKSVPQKRVGVARKAEQPVARAEPGSKGKSLVQVGAFGVPANAEGAAARLSRLGLPVVQSRVTRGGKVLQIVYAGPFGSAAEARAALSAARNAGFGDAILR